MTTLRPLNYDPRKLSVTPVPKPVRVQPQPRWDPWSEIGRLILLGGGSLTIFLSVLAMTRGWHDLAAMFSAYFGWLLVGEGRKLL